MKEYDCWNKKNDQQKLHFSCEINCATYNYGLVSKLYYPTNAQYIICRYN